MDSKKEIADKIIREVIETIELELSKSPSHTKYWCKDNTYIEADVGSVEDWFDEYKIKLRERYGVQENDDYHEKIKCMIKNDTEHIAAIKQTKMWEMEFNESRQKINAEYDRILNVYKEDV